MERFSAPRMPPVEMNWGPISSWIAAGATIILATIALLGGFRVFDGFRRPHLRLTFQPVQPWCRKTELTSGEGMWIRVRVENVGRETARGCVGQLTSVNTAGMIRYDIDPIRLRWAGVPNTAGFVPLDLRQGQYQFLDVFVIGAMSSIHIATYPDPDYSPGFPTALSLGEEHVVEVAAFADNAKTQALSIRIHYAGDLGRVEVAQERRPDAAFPEV